MTLTHHMGINEGPSCGYCGTSEARCARLAIRCCGDGCTHFTDELITRFEQPTPPSPAPTVTKIRRIQEPTAPPIIHLGRPLEGPSGPLCAETDPELFFPEKGGSTREAKAVCRRCSLQTECLEQALTTGERFGIWGGKSERERRKLADTRGISVNAFDDICPAPSQVPA